MHKTPITFVSIESDTNKNRPARNRTPAMYAAEICCPKLPRHHTLYKNAANITPASPRPRKGWTISAAEALLVDVEVELLVDVPEPVPEPEVEEEVLVEEEDLEEEDWVDLRLAELTVPLVPEEALPDEPEGTTT